MPIELPIGDKAFKNKISSLKSNDNKTNQTNTINVINNATQNSFNNSINAGSSSYGYLHGVCNKINKKINEINNLFDSFDTNKFMPKAKPRKQVRFAVENSNEIEIQDVGDHISNDLLFEAMEEEGRFELPETNVIINDQALFELWENSDKLQNISNDNERVVTINCLKSKLF